MHCEQVTKSVYFVSACTSEGIIAMPNANVTNSLLIYVSII